MNATTKTITATTTNKPLIQANVGKTFENRRGIHK